MLLLQPIGCLGPETAERICSGQYCLERILGFLNLNI